MQRKRLLKKVGLIPEKERQTSEDADSDNKSSRPSSEPRRKIGVTGPGKVKVFEHRG